MGKNITQPQKAVLRLKINTLGFDALISLARTVVVRMTINVAVFATPDVPLATITTAADALQVAKSGHGTKRNRGSKAEYTDLIVKANTLRVLLIGEVGYIYNTLSPTADVPLYNAQLLLAGFSAKSKRSRVARLQNPRFMRQTNNKTFNSTLRRINWRKGLGLLKGLPVAGYNLYWGGKLQATTTKGNFVIPSGAGSPVIVNVVPFNARGEGNGIAMTVR